MPPVDPPSVHAPAERVLHPGQAVSRYPDRRRYVGRGRWAATYQDRVDAELLALAASCSTLRAGSPIDEDGEQYRRGRTVAKSKPFVNGGGDQPCEWPGSRSSSNPIRIASMSSSCPRPLSTSSLITPPPRSARRGRPSAEAFSCGSRRRAAWARAESALTPGSIEEARWTRCV